MKYLVLISVQKNEMETYLQSWKREKNDVKILHGPFVTYQSIEEAHSFAIIETDKMSEAEQFCENITGTTRIILNPILDEIDTLEEIEKFNANKVRAETDYKNTKIDKITNLGTTTRLEILPLIDWRTDDKDLDVETGVSYLIKTDDTTILFDVGLNPEQKDPSHLLTNMQKLGVSLDDVDIIYLTHNHSDHVGGDKWYKEKTFSLSGKQINLRDKIVYTPEQMSYPGLEPIYSPEPFIVGRGVASIGTIPTSMFIFGYTDEMSLAVNVEGKGIVLIVGCGHQGLSRILERTSVLFDVPLYGIIGGLHYPVMGGPLEVYGYYPHRHMGTGKVPWEQISVDELLDNIELLKSYAPRLVALSPHDSSELSIQQFREAFPDAFKEIRVGKKLVVQ